MVAWALVAKAGARVVRQCVYDIDGVAGVDVRVGHEGVDTREEMARLHGVAASAVPQRQGGGDGGVCVRRQGAGRAGQSMGWRRRLGGMGRWVGQREAYQTCQTAEEMMYAGKQYART